MSKWIMLFILSCGLIGPAMGAVKVVINNGVAVDSLEAKAVADVFLGRKKKLPDGTKAVPVTLGSGAIHDEFLKSFVNRSASQFNSHWKKAVFTGQGKPPKKFKTEAELIAHVAATPGAIGYVSADADVSSVKVIASK